MAARPEERDAGKEPATSFGMTVGCFWRRWLEAPGRVAHMEGRTEWGACSSVLRERCALQRNRKSRGMTAAEMLRHGGSATILCPWAGRLDRCGSVRGGNAHAFLRARPTRGDARMPWLHALVFVQGVWCFSVRGSGESGSGAEGEFERERLVGDFWPDASALATMKAHEAISYCSRAGHGLCKLFHSRSSCLGQVFHEMAHDQAFAVGARCPVL